MGYVHYGSTATYFMFTVGPVAQMVSCQSIGGEVSIEGRTVSVIIHRSGMREVILSIAAPTMVDSDRMLGVFLGISHVFFKATGSGNRGGDTASGAPDHATGIHPLHADLLIALMTAEFNHFFTPRVWLKFSIPTILVHEA